MEIILTLNPNSDIYTFSSYLPSKMNHSYEKPFRELLLMYNQSLLELCREYQLSYVNSRVLEQKSSQKDSLLLAHELLKEMSRNANTWKFNIDCFGYSILLDDTRLAGMMQDIYQDIMNYAYLAATKNGDEQALYLSLFKECGNDFFHFNRGFQKIKKRI
jgi:hypothetical protein